MRIIRHIQLAIALTAPLLALPAPPASAQTWRWAVGAEGSQGTQARAIAVDAQGNSVITGTFSDTLVIGSTQLRSPGVRAIYIAKVTVDGAFAWARIAARDSLVTVERIAIDSADNIIIVGNYFGTAQFGDVSPRAVTSTGDYDAFVAKYDAAGAMRWVRSWGDSGVDYAEGVCADRDGNIVVTGELHHTTYSYSGAKILLAKYDSAGAEVWGNVSRTYGTGHFSNGIQIDAHGDLYLAGSFFDTLQFDSTSIIAAGNIESNVFLAKFDGAGTFLWGRTAGGGSSYAVCRGLTVDGSGNAYVVGGFYGAMALGALGLTSTGASHIYEVFLAKCDSAGTFVWADKSIGAGVASGICVDDAGRCTVAGAFAASIGFGATTLRGDGGAGAFIAQTDRAGNFAWAVAIRAPSNLTVGELAATGNGIALCGGFLDTLHVGPALTLTTHGNAAALFVATLADVSRVADGEIDDARAFLYPNPATTSFTMTVALGSRLTAALVVYDCAGRAVTTSAPREWSAGTHDIRNEVSALRPGVYVVQLRAEHGVPFSARFVKF